MPANTWILLQILLLLILYVSVFLLWIRMLKSPKDDPRLSKGLKILQSKISILEDLSDRTEVQVKQLSALLEEKTIEVQRKIIEANKKLHEIKISMEKSMEIAKIFQDKIPHSEIIDRQNTVKYIKAAKMAHKGFSKEEIAKYVDLPLSELDFIIKINKEDLLISSESLPEWVNWEKESTDQVDTKVNHDADIK